MTTAYIHTKPPKWTTAAQLQQDIQNYFDNISIIEPITYLDPATQKEKTVYKRTYIEPPTVTGLAIALGTNRQTILNYQRNDTISRAIPAGEIEGIFDAISRAKEVCQAYAHQALYTNKSANGPAFDLKNNYGWDDTIKQQHSLQVEAVDLSRLTDAELEQYLALKAKVSSPQIEHKPAPPMFNAPNTARDAEYTDETDSNDK